MPVQVPTIDDEIAYILEKWIQNSAQLITGTIGQNVVWNLAQFIKQNPENYQKATVVASSSNYTTNNNQCIVIFTNNASGTLNWVDNRWNKYYFVNATNNIRAFSNGKFYWDINGVAKITIPARTSLYIAKGDDDYWYEVTASGSGGTSTGSSLRYVVGETDGPVEGQSTWQHDSLRGLGGIDDRYLFTMDNVPMMSYGTAKNFDFNSTDGIIDITPNVWVGGSGLDLPLMQTAN